MPHDSATNQSEGKCSVSVGSACGHRMRLLLMSITKRNLTSPFSMRFMASFT
jgi:hypothetical protein